MDELQETPETPGEEYHEEYQKEALPTFPETQSQGG